MVIWGELRRISQSPLSGVFPEVIWILYKLVAYTMSKKNACPYEPSENYRLKLQDLSMQSPAFLAVVFSFILHGWKNQPKHNQPTPSQPSRMEKENPQEWVLSSSQHLLESSQELSWSHHSSPKLTTRAATSHWHLFFSSSQQAPSEGFALAPHLRSKRQKIKQGPKKKTQSSRKRSYRETSGVPFTRKFCFTSRAILDQEFRGELVDIGLQYR